MMVLKPGTQHQRGHDSFLPGSPSPVPSVKWNSRVPLCFGQASARKLHPLRAWPWVYSCVQLFRSHRSQRVYPNGWNQPLVITDFGGITGQEERWRGIPLVKASGLQWKSTPFKKKIYSYFLCMFICVRFCVAMRPWEQLSTESRRELIKSPVDEMRGG